MQGASAYMGFGADAAASFATAGGAAYHANL